MTILSAMNIGYLQGMGKAWGRNLAIMITSLIASIIAVIFMLSEFSQRSIESRVHSEQRGGYKTVKVYGKINEAFGGTFVQTSLALVFAVAMITLGSLVVSDLRAQGNFSNLSSFNKITLGSQLTLSVIYMLLVLGFSYGEIKRASK